MHLLIHIFEWLDKHSKISSSACINAHISVGSVVGRCRSISLHSWTPLFQKCISARSRGFWHIPQTDMMPPVSSWSCIPWETPRGGIRCKASAPSVKKAEPNWSRKDALLPKKDFRMALKKMDVQDFRLEISVIQLQCKISGDHPQLLMYLHWQRWPHL